MGENGKPLEEERGERKPSSWRLMDRQSPLDIEEYKRERFRELLDEQEEGEVGQEVYERRMRVLWAGIEQEGRKLWGDVYRFWRRECLVEALEELDARERGLSLRVVRAWHQQWK